jgi:uncharacterized protein
MNYAVSDQLTLDARRAAWLPQERVLAVADLHLGYAWAHRLAGQLLPITAREDTLARLQALQRDYRPEKMVVLGDIVHRAVALPPLREELSRLVEGLASGSELLFLTGNHDADLPPLLDRWHLPVKVAASATIGSFLLVHGDEAVPKKSQGRKRIVMGHEHPSITIGDGVTTSQKCPCFLVSQEVVVLPAFSLWAAGSNSRAGAYLSHIALRARFSHAVAICGDRLLPIKLQNPWKDPNAKT